MNLAQLGPRVEVVMQNAVWLLAVGCLSIETIVAPVGDLNADMLMFGQVNLVLLSMGFLAVAVVMISLPPAVLLCTLSMCWVNHNGLLLLMMEDVSGLCQTFLMLAGQVTSEVILVFLPVAGLGVAR